MTITQRAALSNDETVQGSTIQELPTGTGKTAKGFANLLAMRERYGEGTYFYITPNKALVDQVKKAYPEFQVIYGRNEYDCYYYEQPQFKADQVPCSLLSDCHFRVNFETGKTHEPGVIPCPYLQAKWKAKSKLVVCTMSFYLFAILFSDQWQEIKGVVVDEAHQIADVIRGALSYEITDFHLEGIIEFLRTNQIQGDKEFGVFLNLIKRAIRKHSYKDPLLHDKEINGFIDVLKKIKRHSLENEVKKALRARTIADDQREMVKKLEMVINSLHRYIQSFEFSLDTNRRNALNYTYGYVQPKTSDTKKVEYALHIKCYHVAPIIKKIFPENKTFFMSATIGNIDVFRMVTGLQYPFFAYPSQFPVQNARIYLPVDIEDLAVAKAKTRGKAKTIRRIARTCKKFIDHGHRSLVLLVSEEERQQFLKMAAEEGLEVVSYGDGLKSKEAVLRFKQGIGDVLTGTFGQYGEGIDLPNQLAPVTFVLRPSYPPPGDPKAIYEERRFKNSKWILWNSRETQRLLQARGRNIRGETDKGVTFCMSLQYKKFILQSLPKWLHPAYYHSRQFEECVSDALNLLKT